MFANTTDDKPENTVLNRKKPEESSTLSEEIASRLKTKSLNNKALENEKDDTPFSFMNYVKSIFQRKNEYPTDEKEEVDENICNLHLRMHELFMLHDDLCQISEIINDLYSFGMKDLLFLEIFINFQI